MLSFFEEFNNREIAVAIWFAAILCFAFLSKGVRQASLGVVKIFFSWKLQVVFLSLCLYAVLIIWLLYTLRLWEFTLLKDTIFWFFGVAFLLIFRVTAKTETNFFKVTLKDAWKWTILIEFISNLYVFSLWLELILTFIIISFSAMKPIADGDKKYKDVSGCISKSISVLSAFIILFSLYKTIEHYKEFFSMENTRSILVSPVLTVLYMPFLYLLTLMFQYETLFIRLKFMSRDDKAFRRSLKWQVFKTAKFNLTKVNNISSNIMKADLYTIENIPGYLKAISKGSKSKRK